MAAGPATSAADAASAGARDHADVEEPPEGEREPADTEFEVVPQVEEWAAAAEDSTEEECSELARERHESAAFERRQSRLTASAEVLERAGFLPLPQAQDDVGQEAPHSQLGEAAIPEVDREQDAAAPLGAAAEREEREAEPAEVSLARDMDPVAHIGAGEEAAVQEACNGEERQADAEVVEVMLEPPAAETPAEAADAGSADEVGGRSANASPTAKRWADEGGVEVDEPGQWFGGLDAANFDEVADELTVLDAEAPNVTRPGSSRGDEVVEAGSSGGEPPKGASKGSGKGVLFVQGGGRELTLSLKHRNLGIEQVRAILTGELRRSIREKLRALHGNAPFHYINVDLSENDLGADGAAILVAFLRQLHQPGTLSEGKLGKGDKGGKCGKGKLGPPVSIKALRLFRNRLGDEGARHIAELVIEQPQPLIELHLSHNGLTGLGAAMVLLAFGAARSRAYPFRLPHRPSLFGGSWLRLERNDVEAPEALLEALKARGGVRFLHTSWTQRDWGPARSPAWATNAERVPQVILHIFSVQGRQGAGWSQGKGAGKSEVGLCREHVKAAAAVIADLVGGKGGKGGKSNRKAAPADTGAPQSTSNAAVELPERQPESDDAADVERKHQKKEFVWKPKLPPPSGSSAASSSAAPRAKETTAPKAASVSESSMPRVEHKTALQSALEKVTNLLPASSHNDPGLLDRWRSHVAVAADPEREAKRIANLASRLQAQGYPEPGAWRLSSGLQSSTAREQASAILLQSLKAGPGGAGAQGQAARSAAGSPQLGPAGRHAAARSLPTGPPTTGARLGAPPAATAQTVEEVEAGLLQTSDLGRLQILMNSPTAARAPAAGEDAAGPLQSHHRGATGAALPLASSAPAADAETAAGRWMAPGECSGPSPSDGAVPELPLPSGSEGATKKKGKNKIGVWAGGAGAPRAEATSASDAGVASAASGVNQVDVAIIPMAGIVYQ